MRDLLAMTSRVPHLRPGLVERARLVARLHAGLTRRLTVVTAPAGFGKTTLVASWAAGTSRPTAWLTLEPADDDADRFLNHMAAAVEAAVPTVGRALGAFLHDHPGAAPERAFAYLIHEASLGEPFSVVLDDYHVIESTSVHAGLEFLIAHLSPPLHVTIVSRVDPPLPLARWRAHGELSEVRAADLRFTKDEVADFLVGHVAAPLLPEQLASLESRTEGWIAALQLVAVALQGRDEARTFLDGFTGSHRYVVDYLTEEVLNLLPAEVETFLLSTAILGRLTGPLCDAVTGRSDGGATLERLEAANLFVVPLDDDRRWFRYHQLFAEALQDRLRHRATPAEVLALHDRAARWYEGANLLEEAARHALAAGDEVLAARLVERFTDGLWLRGELMAVEAWLERLSREVVRRRPRLLMTQAWTRFLLRSYDAAAVHDLLDEAATLIAGRTSPPPDAPGEDDTRGRLAAIRAAVASAAEDAPRTLALAAEARHYLAPGPGPWATVLALSEGLAYDALGDARGAERSLGDAATGRDAAGPGYLVQVATVNLGRVQMLRGRLGAAVRTSQRALDLAGGHAEGRSPVASYPHVVLGRVAYERNDLAGASARFTTAIELASADEHLRALVDGLLGLARTRWAWLDLRGARAAIQRALEVATATGAPWATTQVMVERARLALRTGHVGEASRLVDEARRRGAGAGGDVGASIAVRVLAAQGFALDALAASERFQAEAEAGGRAMDALELLVVRSLILGDLERSGDARESLELALAHAEPEGLLRVFLDEAEPLATLLRNALADHAAPAYAADVLAAFAARPGPGPTAPDREPLLNERETTVLQLMAARRSDKEIARAMGLSVSTVKWYAQRVFTKLGAHRRTEAVAHARARGLL